MRLLAVFLSVLSAVLVSIFNILSVYVLPVASAGSIISIRYTFQALFSTCIMIYRNNWVNTSLKELMISLLTGVICGVYMLLAADSLRYIPSVDYAAIFQTQLIFVILISGIWLEERISLYEAFLMTIMTIGVMLTCQPNFLFHSSKMKSEASTIWGYSEMTITAFFSAVSSCIVRKVKHVDPFFISAMQGLMAAFTALILGWNNFVFPEDLFNRVVLIINGLSSAFYIIFFTIALTIENPSLVTGIFSLETVFTALLQMAVFNDIPNALSFFGCFIIVIASALLPLKDRFYQMTANQRIENN